MKPLCRMLAGLGLSMFPKRRRWPRLQCQPTAAGEVYVSF